MNTTYVSLKYWGSYEDKEVIVLYAGNDYDKAKESTNGVSNDGEVRGVSIEHWVDGKKIKEEDIY